MKPLDPTQQRILGVLIEKELSVPESYPLTENSLQLGCNQKNNRYPVVSLEEFEVHGTLLGLQEDGWVARSERDGGRTLRYRHLVEGKLGLDAGQKAILAELLLRGPQTRAELKVRVGRMGLQADEARVEAMLGAMKFKEGHPLVELLPKAPRERDPRWAHRLGPRPAQSEAQPADVPGPTARHAQPEAARGTLEARLDALEARVAALEQMLGKTPN